MTCIGYNIHQLWPVFLVQSCVHEDTLRDFFISFHHNAVMWDSSSVLASSTVWNHDSRLECQPFFLLIVMLYIYYFLYFWYQKSIFYDNVVTPQLSLSTLWLVFCNGFHLSGFDVFYMHSHCSCLFGWFLLLTFWCFGFFVLFLSFSRTGMNFWQEFLFVTVLSSQHCHLCLDLTCLDLSYTDVTYIFNFLFLISPFLTFLWMHYFSY